MNRKPKVKKWALITAVIGLLGLGISSYAVYPFGTENVKAASAEESGRAGTVFSEGIRTLTKAFSLNKTGASEGGSTEIMTASAGEYIYVYVRENNQLASFDEDAQRKLLYGDSVDLSKCGPNGSSYFPLGQIPVPEGTTVDNSNYTQFLENNIQYIETGNTVFKDAYSGCAGNNIRTLLNANTLTVAGYSTGGSEEFSSAAEGDVSGHINLEFVVHTVNLKAVDTNKEKDLGVRDGGTLRKLYDFEINDLFSADGKRLTVSYYSDAACQIPYDFSQEIKNDTTVVYAKAVQRCYVYLQDGVNSSNSAGYIADTFGLTKKEGDYYPVGWIDYGLNDTLPTQDTVTLENLLTGADIFEDGFKDNQNNSAAAAFADPQNSLRVLETAERGYTPGFAIDHTSQNNNESYYHVILKYTYTLNYRDIDKGNAIIASKDVIPGQKAMTGRVVGLNGDLGQITGQITEYYAYYTNNTDKQEFDFDTVVNADTDIYVKTTKGSVLVYIYIMDNGWKTNEAVKQWIGVNQKDNHDFYPFGSFELDAADITAIKNNGIAIGGTGAGTWEDLKSKILAGDVKIYHESGISKDAGTVVGEVLKYTSLDYPDGINPNSGKILNVGGKGYTAFFPWQSYENSLGFETGTPAVYHLDLRLNLYPLTFMGVIADKNGTVTDKRQKLGEYGYFQNQPIACPEGEDYFDTSGYIDSNDYYIEGYYNDASCQGEKLTCNAEDMLEGRTFSSEGNTDTIYVKLVPKTYQVSIICVDENGNGFSPAEGEYTLPEEKYTLNESFSINVLGSVTDSQGKTCIYKKMQVNGTDKYGSAGTYTDTVKNTGHDDDNKVEIKLYYGKRYAYVYVWSDRSVSDVKEQLTPESADDPVKIGDFYPVGVVDLTDAKVYEDFESAKGNRNTLLGFLREHDVITEEAVFTDTYKKNKDNNVNDLLSESVNRLVAQPDEWSTEYSSREYSSYTNLYQGNSVKVPHINLVFNANKVTFVNAENKEEIEKAGTFVLQGTNLKKPTESKDGELAKYFKNLTGNENMTIEYGYYKNEACTEEFTFADGWSTATIEKETTIYVKARQFVYVYFVRPNALASDESTLLSRDMKVTTPYTAETDDPKQFSVGRIEIPATAEYANLRDLDSLDKWKPFLAAMDTSLSDNPGNEVGAEAYFQYLRFHEKPGKPEIQTPQNPGFSDNNEKQFFHLYLELSTCRVSFKWPDTDKEFMHREVLPGNAISSWPRSDVFQDKYGTNVIWYSTDKDGKNEFSKDTVIQEDLVLYVQPTYAVTIKYQDKEGNTIPGTTEVTLPGSDSRFGGRFKDGEEYELTTAVIPPSITTDTGIKYDFVHYTINGGEGLTALPHTGNIDQSDVTVIARYEKAKYKITYHMPDNTTIEQEVVSGDTAPKLEKTELENHGVTKAEEAEYFTTDQYETKYDFDTVITGNTNIYVKEKTYTVTIKYQDNSGNAIPGKTDVALPESGAGFKDGADYTLTTELLPDEITTNVDDVREVYVFKGYRIDDGEEQTDRPYEGKINKADVTVTARYEKLAKYTVTYHMPDNTTIEKEVIYGEKAPKLEEAELKGHGVTDAEKAEYYTTDQYDTKYEFTTGITGETHIYVKEKEPEPTPTPTPTATPTEKPTATPTVKPTEAPTATPTEKPTATPTEVPTAAPTAAPTEAPTAAPTAVPTEEPTAAPTEEPTAVPTEEPTAAPTEEPTAVPTEEPTAAPTEEPTAVPTEEPTAVPTEVPTAAPTEAPTAAPTEVPTAAPTEAPTEAPTAVPTAAPTEAPTAVPTAAPTEAPTAVPTAAPTEAPTVVPTAVPTEAPTAAPTEAPTAAPTAVPTTAPTATPTATVKPTATPKPTATVKPTATPKPTATVKPTATPRPTATIKPTATPRPTATIKPTATPTATPSPTATPDRADAVRPTATPRSTATPRPTGTPSPKATATPKVTPKPAGTSKTTPKPTGASKATPKPTGASKVTPTVRPAIRPDTSATPMLALIRPTEEPTAAPTAAPTPETTEQEKQATVVVAAEEQIKAIKSETEVEVLSTATPAPTSTPKKERLFSATGGAGKSVKKITKAIGNTAEKAYNAVGRVIYDATDFVKETFHIADEDVPLTNIQLSYNNHRCCILHLLLAIISAVVLGCYAGDRKKQQKKLHELREELDTELIKRGLSVTSEDKKERKR